MPHSSALSSMCSCAKHVRQIKFWSVKLKALLLLLCRVGIKPPGIEVRFQDIFIETSVYTNVSRNLPSILNAYRGFFEV